MSKNIDKNISKNMSGNTAKNVLIKPDKTLQTHLKFSQKEQFKKHEKQLLI